MIKTIWAKVKTGALKAWRKWEDFVWESGKKILDAKQKISSAVGSRDPALIRRDMQNYYNNLNSLFSRIQTQREKELLMIQNKLEELQEQQMLLSQQLQTIPDGFVGNIYRPVINDGLGANGIYMNNYRYMKDRLSDPTSIEIKILRELQELKEALGLSSAA